MAHPLAEILLLVVCATIASCDDFDDIAAWGEAHLAFLRTQLPYYHGVPCARWLNIMMNRIDPNVFSDCFMAWATTLRPDVPLQIAPDGKTLRRSHDRSAGKAALHLVSAFATHEKLVLGQEATEEKSNEIMAIRRCWSGWHTRALWREPLSPLMPLAVIPALRPVSLIIEPTI